MNGKTVVITGATSGIGEAAALALAAQGARIVDVGGRSYGRHVAAATTADERARVVPVVEALAGDGLGIALSVIEILDVFVVFNVFSIIGLIFDAHVSLRPRRE